MANLMRYIRIPRRPVIGDSVEQFEHPPSVLSQTPFEASQELEKGTEASPGTQCQDLPSACPNLL